VLLCEYKVIVEILWLLKDIQRVKVRKCVWKREGRSFGRQRELKGEDTFDFLFRHILLEGNEMVS